MYIKELWSSPRYVTNLYMTTHRLQLEGNSLFTGESGILERYPEFMVCILQVVRTRALRSWSSTILQNYASLPFALPPAYAE